MLLNNKSTFYFINYEKYLRFQWLLNDDNQNMVNYQSYVPLLRSDYRGLYCEPLFKRKKKKNLGKARINRRFFLVKMVTQQRMHKMYYNQTILLKCPFFEVKKINK